MLCRVGWQHCCLQYTEGTLKRVIRGRCQLICSSRQRVSDCNCCGLWEPLFLPGAHLRSNLRWQEGQTSSWEHPRNVFSAHLDVSRVVGKMYAHFRAKIRCALLCVYLNVFSEEQYLPVRSYLTAKHILSSHPLLLQFSSQAEGLWAGTQGKAAKQVQSTVVGKTDKLLILVEYLVMWWNCKIRPESKGTKQLACPPIWQHVVKTPYWKCAGDVKNNECSAFLPIFTIRIQFDREMCTC